MCGESKFEVTLTLTLTLTVFKKASATKYSRLSGFIRKQLM